MSDRYKRLFSLKENLYTEGSPVIISAGALLLDTNTNKVLAQCKFKNISFKTIKGLTVYVRELDTGNRPIGNAISYQYLDLNAGRDIEFGQKSAITLPDETTRAFVIVVSEVIFDDNSVWNAQSSATWDNVPEQKDLYPEDEELRKQYNLDINKQGSKEILYYKDLWKCSCGAINKITEETCHLCNTQLKTMETVDESVLKENIKNSQYNQACSLMNENKKDSCLKAIEIFKSLDDFKDSKVQIDNCNTLLTELKKQEELDAKKKKKKKFKTIIIICIVIALIIGLFVFMNFQTENKYQQAKEAISNTDYDGALEILNNIETYNDASVLITYCNAMKDIQNQDYDSAYNKLNKIKENEYASEALKHWVNIPSTHNTEGNITYTADGKVTKFTHWLWDSYEERTVDIDSIQYDELNRIISFNVNDHEYGNTHDSYTITYDDNSTIHIHDIFTHDGSTYTHPYQKEFDSSLKVSYYKAKKENDVFIEVSSEDEANFALYCYSDLMNFSNLGNWGKGTTDMHLALKYLDNPKLESTYFTNYFVLDSAFFCSHY